MTNERAVLAGGCFWGMQDLIRNWPGSSARGWVTPVAMCRTRLTATMAPTPKRSRSVRPFAHQLSPAARVLFQVHDPSTRNRQGNDVGASYRSAIFITSDQQRAGGARRRSRTSKHRVVARAGGDGSAPAGPFWEAEPEHQDYLEHYPGWLHLSLRAAGLEAAQPGALQRSLMEEETPRASHGGGLTPRSNGGKRAALV